MNKKVKNNTKKILIMLLIVTLCNFIVPNYSYAGLIGDYVIDAILDSFAELLLVVPDNMFCGMQRICLGDGNIKNGDKYSIKLAPGTIFAGKISAFNINFIKRDTNVKKIIKSSDRVGFTSANTFAKAIEIAKLQILKQFGYEYSCEISEDNKKIIKDIRKEIKENWLDIINRNEIGTIEKKINDWDYTIEIMKTDPGDGVVGLIKVYKNPTPEVYEQRRYVLQWRCNNGS